MTGRQIKAFARERMLGNYRAAISATLMYIAIRMMVSGMISSLFSPTNPMMLVLNLAAGLILDLISGILLAGIAYFFLNLMYERRAVSLDIFHAFFEQPDKAVLIMLVLTAAAQAYGIPASVTMYLYFSNQTSGLALWAVATVIGFLFYLAIWLNYSQSFYLLQDFPDRSARDLLRMSRTLMQGHKAQLLLLLVSFLPLLALGVVTFVLPLLWVNVYFQATLAAYYRELMNERTGH